MEKINNQEIEVCIKSVLNFDGNIEKNKNLLELGLSSIQIMNLTSQFRKKGYECTFAKLISHPTIEQWEKILSEKSDGQKNNITVDSNEEDMYKPFPLTEVQYAYWIGRKEGQAIGRVGCHGYLEIDGENVDPRRLEYAWDMLQVHHPMLRVAYTKDGFQKILKKPYKNGITVYDYREKDATEHLKNMREKLSHRLMDIDHGQVAELQITLLPDGKTKIHFDIDLLICDVKSFQIILRDLGHTYVTGELPPAPAEWNFAEYIYRDEQRKLINSSEAEKYWKKRLETLPGNPEIPMRQVSSNVKPLFHRRKAVLSMEKWKRFKKIATSHGITPAMALLTLYGSVIARWSQNQDFLMNIPLFNRNEEEEGIENVVADFTTLLLLEMNLAEKRSFIKSAKKVQNQFHQDMEYIDYSGIKLERDYKKLHPETEMVAPIVFSCNLGIPLFNHEFEEYLGHMSYMISQTPQVWLDFQLFDVNEGMMMIWDSVDEVFPEHLLDDMFEAYTDSLERLATNEELWEMENVISIDRQIQIRKSFEVTRNDIPDGPIYGKFFDIAKSDGQRIAVVDEKLGNITYEKLAYMAKSVVAYLRTQSVKKGDSVGIACCRGVGQIAAMLGVLASGGKYVIVGNTQPLNRKKVICDKASIQLVITDEENKWEEIPQVTVAQMQEIVDIDPVAKVELIEGHESAYVIFTSGTTGEPKGVEITHHAAVNTIYSLNQMYSIGENDSVLAVSNTDFDLSVYDVFGMLSVGGKIVLLTDNDRKNALRWCELVKEQGVTVWNSVPVLLDMLTLEAKANGYTFESLRYAMQSGDWIGMDLPKRLNEVAPNARFIAMGGATEAAIWSNYQEVLLPIEKSWKTIPYGHPLPNQKYRVVNAMMYDCPDLVAGELWIGGEGVAVGYISEPDLTDQKFTIQNGERWYKTGDYGRFWKDGTIEFLGRRDYQVKIRGHRIELEEIENNIKNHNCVEQAIVMPIENEQGHKYLSGFVVPKSINNESVDEVINEKAEQLKSVMDSMKEELAPVSNADEIKENLDDCAIQMMAYLCEEIRKSGKPVVEEYKNLYEIWLDKTASIKTNNNSEVTSEIAKELRLFEDNAIPMLTGKIEPYEFMESNNFYSMDEFADKTSGATEKNTLLYRLASILARGKKEIRIWEIGAGKAEYTKELLDSLKGIKTEYIISDSTESHLSRAREVLLSYDVNFAVMNLSESEYVIKSQAEKFDVIIAGDSLHREKNISMALRRIRESLKDTGVLLVGEKTQKENIAYVTAGLLAKKDGGNITLYSNSEWEKLFEQEKFACIVADCDIHTKLGQFNQNVFIGIAKEKRAIIDKEELTEYLETVVPEYMVPSIMLFLEEIPITGNGKIDRRTLQGLLANEKIESKKTKPEGELALQVAEIWKRILHTDEIYLEDDFYLLGGDSLLATQMTIGIKKELHMELALEDIFQNPVFDDFLNLILEKREDIVDVETDELPAIVFEPENIYKPFPMTDIQQSYWIGRSGAYELGDVGVHCYFEMDCEHLDVEELEKAWNKLIVRHDMMRAVMQTDGKNQIILEKVPYYHIDEETFGEEEADKLIEVRKKMANHVFQVTEWPMFEVRASRIGNQKTRLHLSFDNIVFDGFSIFRLFNEWKVIYNQEEYLLPEIRGSFRDYCMAQEKLKDTQLYEKQLNYWKERVETMPPAPQLPLVDADEVENQQFTRFEWHLSREEREKIKKITEKYHLTSTIVFLTAYAQVLGRYSKSQHFTLNLTRFQKLALYEGVEELIGDFTTLTLLEIDLRQGVNFLERCRNVQKQLLEDMKNALVSGVVVEREWQKTQNNQGVSMPVVFTSGFGVNSKGNAANEALGDIVYGESQTSQVWIDHQISEQNGQLFLSWDAVCGLFPDHFVEKMFHSYQELIRALMLQENWESTKSLINLKDVEKIQKNTWEYAQVSGETLVSLYEKSVNRYGDRIAIESAHEKVTYSQLDYRVNLVAASLINEGIKPGDVVGILLEKGINQVYAAMAILKAGAVYLPIDIHNPRNRIESILRQSQAKLMITESNCSEELKESFADWNPCCMDDLLSRRKGDIYNYPMVIDSDIAYIIFTSGSTGAPKGVVITHRGAVNTILDVNKRFNVTKEDGTIFISNLNFDLSVYDVFGMLCVGGKIVVPDADKVKEPAHWIELLIEHGVTVWNSVPAFLTMLTDYRDDRKEQLENSLRLIMMSGDWIPVSLPDRLKNIFHNVKVVSLGGATECSIWSNYYVVEGEVPQNWKSIPYGKPLTNQRFFILNEMGEDCPIWVPGELYIAGEGVAKGYCRDEEKTKAAFISIEGDVNSRMYRTGDLGRFMADGNIEFLGREDNQIKKNGHRIECGEIESQIRGINGVENAVVTATREQQVMITAHLTLTDDSEFYRYEEETDIYETETFFEKCEGLQRYLSDEKLLQFMNAVNLVALESMLKDLITLNGKIMTENLINEIGTERYGEIGKAVLSLYVDMLQESEIWEDGEKLDEALIEVDKQWRSNPKVDVLIELWEKLEQSRSLRLMMLEGKKSAKEVMVEDTDIFPMPAILAKYDLAKEKSDDSLRCLLETYGIAYGSKKVEVLEVGSRAADDTKILIDIFGDRGAVTYGDESSYYIDIKKEQFYDQIEYMQMNLEDEPSFIKEHRKFDLIVADNTLHRMKDLNRAVKNLKDRLKAGGTLILIENLQNVPLMMLTTAYLEEGYQYLEDERRERHLPMLDRNQWIKIMKAQQLEPRLENVIATENPCSGKQIMVFQKDVVDEKVQYELLREQIKEKVAEYMMPDNILVYGRFPLSANGKVDRKVLVKVSEDLGEVIKKQVKAASTELEKRLLDVWTKTMHTKEASVDDNFFTSGGDSLKAIIFINALKEQEQLEVSLQELFENPSVEQLAQLIENRVQTEIVVDTEEGEL